MKQTRRNFLKSALWGIGSISIIAKASGLLNKAYAAVKSDSKITSNDYLHKGPPTDAKLLKIYDGKHLKAAKKKDPNFNAIRNCENCKQFNVKGLPADGWGKCAMVGATGKDCKWVWKEGWCKVWVPDTSIKKA